MMLHRTRYVASAVSTALSTSALRSDAFLIRLRNTAAAAGTAQDALRQLQRLAPRAARDAPLGRSVREVDPHRAGWLACALVVVLPTNQCAAADVLGAVRHTMPVLGERRKWHEISVVCERSIRAGSTVRVGHAVEAHTYGLQSRCCTPHSRGSTGTRTNPFAGHGRTLAYISGVTRYTTI